MNYPVSKDENEWRALLQASDRKMLEKAEDWEPIVEKEVVEDMFNKVQSFCPTSCMYTDIKYFKTVISNEKSRLKRVEAKEKDLRDNSLLSNTQSSSSVGNGASSDGNLEHEKKLEAERLAKANAIKDAIAASALTHTNSPALKVGKVLGD